MRQSSLFPKAARLRGAMALLLVSQAAVSADTLGFVEQKFTYLNFERGKWDRVPKLPCYSYSAKEDGAVVEVLRMGAGNLVPFRATKGLSVSVCGSTATFDEGFEAAVPITNKAVGK